jgi:hypothetical protein
VKPSPYYQNERELARLIEMRDAFRFSEAEAMPKLVALIAGREGSGKTHLACTMSEIGPVYLLDTEYRGQIVTRKFRNVKFAVIKSYEELVVAVKHILKHQAPGTIVLDSGSDLQTFAEIKYLERTEREKVGMPWNWAEVWRLCNAIIDDIRFSERFHLVITARLKEEYLNEKATGQMIPRVYSPLPYKADVILQFNGPKERKITVTKNGFTGELDTPVESQANLPALIRQLSRPREDAPASPPKITQLKIAHTQ